MQSVFLRRALPSIRRGVLTQHARYLATKPPARQGKLTADASKPPSPPKKSEEPTPEASPSETTQSEAAPPSPTTLSLDFSPIAESENERSQQTGARSSEGSLSSIERRRRFMGRATLVAFGFGLIAGVFYLGRDWEEDELKAKKLKIENAPSTRFGKTKERFTSLFDYFSKPTWEELLPPSVPPFQKPYTLLLSIDDLLVASTWDRQNGWRTAKRPGVDYFIAYLAQFYEIVIFTSQNHYTAIPIIEKLDPYNFFITYKLFREATRSVNGTIVKDLSYLNRDLSKVIIVDTDPEHVSLQPENAIIVPKWKGERSDKGLVSLIPFLESIAIYKPQDVRPILKAYHGKDIPIEYAKKEAEAKRQFLEEWRQSGKAMTSGGGFTLSNLFGGSSSRAHSPEPLTYLEQKRKDAQAQYLEEQAYIAANREQFNRLIEEDRQAAAAQMSGNLWSLMQGMAGAPPTPQDQQLADKGADKEAEAKRSKSTGTP